MNNEVFEVMGIEFRRSNRTGSPYTVLHLGVPFPNKDAGLGLKVSTEYIPTNASMPDNLEVGHHIEFSWGRGLDGKAVCNGVHIVEKQ